MDKETVLLAAVAFVVSTSAGYMIGSTQQQDQYDGFREDVSYTANATNPIEEVRFDDRNMSLIVQPGEKADFFIEYNEKVEPIEGLKHDGDIREGTDFVTLEGNMYLLNFRYTDDPDKNGDEWITLYRVIEL